MATGVGLHRAAAEVGAISQLVGCEWLQLCLVTHVVTDVVTRVVTRVVIDVMIHVADDRLFIET